MTVDPDDEHLENDELLENDEQNNVLTLRLEPSGEVSDRGYDRCTEVARVAATMRIGLPMSRVRAVAVRHRF